MAQFNAAFAHGGEMSAATDDAHLVPRTRKHRGHDISDCSGANDQNAHRCGHATASAEPAAALLSKRVS
jgi:hypothetical protein